MDHFLFSVSEPVSRVAAECGVPGPCTPGPGTTPPAPHGDSDAGVRHCRQPGRALSIPLQSLSHFRLSPRLQLRSSAVAPLAKLRLVDGRNPQNNIYIRPSEHSDAGLLLPALSGHEENVLEPGRVKKQFSSAAEDAGVSQATEEFAPTRRSHQRSSSPNTRQRRCKDFLTLPCLPSQPSGSPFCHV